MTRWSSNDLIEKTPDLQNEMAVIGNYVILFYLQPKSSAI